MEPPISDKTAAAPQRVIAYIDGFNLYFGLKSSNYKRYYWLDLHRMVDRLLLPPQTLVGVKYLTSLVSGTPANPGKPRRQGAYLEALATRAIQVFYGHYMESRMQCRRCGATWSVHDEKMTDVNIATEMLADAFDDRYDVAMLVSADSDLVGPIQAVRSRFPAKRIVVAFPPNRASKRLRQVVSASLTIGRGVIAASQLPEQITKPDGFVLRRPSEWR